VAYLSLAVGGEASNFLLSFGILLSIYLDGERLPLVGAEIYVSLSLNNSTIV
jgi:hypothetical protein